MGSFRVAVVAGNPKLDLLQLIGYQKNCRTRSRSGKVVVPVWIERIDFEGSDLVACKI